MRFLNALKFHDRRLIESSMFNTGRLLMASGWVKESKENAKYNQGL
jgi:hypothetical protein